MTLLMNMGIVAVIAVSAYFVANNTSSASTVIAFMQYFTLISMAMMSLSRMFVMYTKCAASAKRISLVMSCESELKICEDNVKGDSSLHVSFENVSFSYLGKKDNLSHVSFSLKKGETLGIIGATGSGKTTLLSLLMRFYDVKGGNGIISLGGRDVRTMTPEELREKFGIAMQNDFIFAGTIEENIRFGRNIPHDDIVLAAKIAQAYDFISALPDGFEHKLTTKGTNLSGGQKQRLLIARAIAGKPEILILDDASSALDYRTDAALRMAIREAQIGAGDASPLAHTTSIIVAQRVSSVKHADLILVMDGGRIIGQGSHDDLMNTCPIYKEIADSQMGGAIID